MDSETPVLVVGELASGGRSARATKTVSEGLLLLGVRVGDGAEGQRRGRARMGKDSGIQWTHHTFNPWWGCKKVSPGCTNCYAAAFDKRVGGMNWGKAAPTILRREALEQPPDLGRRGGEGRRAASRFCTQWPTCSRIGPTWSIIESDCST